MLSAKGEYSQYEKMYEQILAQQNISESKQTKDGKAVIADAA